jgi:hypothetical protein
LAGNDKLVPGDLSGKYKMLEDEPQAPSRNMLDGHPAGTEQGGFMQLFLYFKLEAKRHRNKNCMHFHRGG